jgi:uncharacterized protein YndB with AHSA1/START domain
MTITMPTTLPHRLDRTVVIQASPQIVFTFFTQNDRWAAWWGPGSTIDARSGGQLFIRHPGGIESSGEVVEVVAPERIVFTYGFNSGNPIPPGSSKVTIRLEPVGLSTRIHLLHEFAEATVRDEHVQGWRYQLALFGNVVADVVNAKAADVVDAWFAVWSETDADARGRELSRIASPAVRFRDRFSLLDGVADIVPHIGAAQRFMPDMHLKRQGDVRHCQGTLLADWVAVSGDGQARGSGTNVFTLQGDGLIESVVSFWAPPKQSPA